MRKFLELNYKSGSTCNADKNDLSLCGWTFMQAIRLWNWERTRLCF